ncbi:hypothetical protein AC249_AIPGENE4206 [Exaiptasia diaphana]|nr:hypothetical protein AC249_AIPGENE4206 [Exaiptasia diaphana]
MEDNISLTNQSNTISKFCKYDEPDTDFEKTAKRTVFVLLFVLGICGNVFVITLAAKYTVRKNINHWIINMAVSDAIFLISFLILEIPWLSDKRGDDCASGEISIEVLEIADACIDWESFEFILEYLLPVVNSCFSPLIYIIFLPDFRQAAKHVLCRREIQSREPNSQNSIELQSSRIKPFILRPTNRVRNSETKSSE